jgi:hypothetical protein
MEKEKRSQESAVDVGAMAQIHGNFPRLCRQALFHETAQGQALAHRSPAFDLKKKPVLILVKSNRALPSSHGRLRRFGSRWLDAAIKGLNPETSYALGGQIAIAWPQISQQGG